MYGECLKWPVMTMADVFSQQFYPYLKVLQRENQKLHRFHRQNVQDFRHFICPMYLERL
jgi:hypothetical protein